MLKAVKTYVHAIDAMNRFIGRFTMFLIFGMMAVLLYSVISKNFFNPSLMTLEIAQFLMVAYFLLGGPYSMQMGDHVRMDLLYGSWSDRTKAAVDSVMVIFLFAYLIVLLYGALNSTAYSLGYFGTNPFEFFGGLIAAFFTGGIEGAAEEIGFLERTPTAWRPYMWPIKTVMTIGIFLMLLQAVSVWFKDIAKLRGIELT
ncbi:MAG TPA: TRAP transporter small permease subunit [Devosia sp.]|nr:TRAP transporter small permease subunit [Devosia sp.]